MNLDELQAYEIANRLKGLPTRDTLKAAYIQFDFSRTKVADHFRISTNRLNAIKKKLLGNAPLPSHASYVRQWNEVKWFTGAFPTWTHVQPENGIKNAHYYKSH